MHGFTAIGDAEAITNQRSLIQPISKLEIPLQHHPAHMINLTDI
jgi:hypothetical protein